MMKKESLCILGSVILSVVMLFSVQIVQAEDVDLYQWQMQEYKRVSRGMFIKGRAEQKSKERSIKKFRKMKNLLRKEFDTLHSDVKTWRSANVHKKEQIKKEMEEQKMAIARLEKELEQLQAVNAKLNAQQAVQEKQHEDIQAQLVKQAEEITLKKEEIQKQSKEQNESIDHMKEELVKLEKTSAQLKTEQQERKKKYDELKMQLAKQEKENILMQKEIQRQGEKHNKSVRFMEKGLKKLKKENAKLQAKHKIQKKNYEDIEKQLAKQEKENKDLQREFDINGEAFHQRLMKLYKNQQFELKKKIDAQKKYQKGTQDDLTKLMEVE